MLRARGHSIRVEPRLASIGGIFPLANQLDQMIRNAMRDKDEKDCIAVLHDADEHRQPRREPYDNIREICQRYRDQVVLVIARDEIEAWLLADSGLCGWLGIKPQSYDGQSKPKDTLNSLLKQHKGIKYQGRHREQVWKHLAGDGDQHSESMKKALRHLDTAPCTQPETA